MPLALCLLQAACGFEPALAIKRADGTPAGREAASVAVDPIRGREGQQFQAALEDRLNPGGTLSGAPKYHLKAGLQSSVSPIAVSPDGTASRYNVYLTVTYRLLRAADDQELAKGSLKRVASYNNISNAFYSTYISERDATSRAVVELAEDMRLRILAALADETLSTP